MSDESYIVVIPNKALMRERFLAGWNHAEALLANGDSVQLIVGPSVLPITIKQRNFLHGVVLKQISEQVKVPTFNADGSPTGKTERYVLDTWKEHFRQRFLGWKWEMSRGFVKDKKTGVWRPAKKATPHRVEISSESLGPAKYSKWTDEIIDHSVLEFGVEFVFEQSERDAVRYVSKPRKQQQPETSQ